MKQIDELLNKYIDNELTVSEINELKNYITTNPAELEKLKALKLADSILRELEFESAPVKFTDKLMSRLNVVYKSKPQKNYVIRVIFSLFIAGFLGIFTFGITQISFDFSDSEESRFGNLFERLGELIPSFNFSISSDLLMLIVSILVLITLVATYIIINSHKAFKDNLENIFR
ncbi:MAG: hypothetical protein C4543_07380 [Ignavibacteriales bacterium]|jgi:hypothetical protein|nr:MAG: hypothetical protein C4543_07380 [Ignavibacteriales bacterium]